MTHSVRRWLLRLFAASFVVLPVKAAEVPGNPFNPLFPDSSGESATEAYPDGTARKTHVLQKFPVRQYTLMGTVISEHWGVALVRSVGGQEYFVHEGDALGNGDGKISAINAASLEVSEGEESVLLRVRNRSDAVETGN